MVENRLEAMIDDYFAHCLSEGRRRNTVENAYGYPLRHVFLPWCARERIEEPSQLTRRTMERYQGELLTKGGARGPLSPSTVHSYVRVVNQMLVWARDPESGVEDQVPDGKVRLPKLGRPVKDILNREEIERIEDTARAERDKLIIRVFGDTGMRVGELVRLRTDDLVSRQRKNFLHVRGKGGLSRTVLADAGDVRVEPRVNQRGTGCSLHGQARDDHMRRVSAQRVGHQEPHDDVLGGALGGARYGVRKGYRAIRRYARVGDGRADADGPVRRDGLYVGAGGRGRARVGED